MDKNNRKERPDGKRTAELRLTIEKLEQELAARKQMEGTLRDSQRVSSTLISNLPGMVYRCLNDRSWTVTYLSDGCTALTGYPPRDFIENRIAYGRLIRPDDQDGVWTMVQAAIRDKNPFTLTYRITAADGKEKWVWEQGRGVFASDGELLFLEGFVTDITERKRAEEALRESETRLAHALDATTEGVWDWNIRTGEVLFSPRWIASLGFSPEDVPPHVSFWERLVHPEDLPRVWEALHNHWEGRTPFYECENRLRTKAGTWRYNLDRGRVVEWDAAGKPLRMVGTDTDITDRKRAEESLKLFRVLLDHVWDSIEIFDPHTGRFMDGNEKAWSNLGYARHEFLSLSVSDIDPLVTQATFASNMQRLRETGEELLLDSIHRRKDGTTFPVEVSVQLVRYDKEKEYAVAIVRDITARKKMEQALRRSEKRMAVLSHRLIEVQETERKHVARELHDEIGQCLTGLKLGLETALRLRESASRTMLLQIVAQVDALISRSRELSLDLRPAMLDDMGLLPALQFHFKRFRERLGLRVRFEHRGIEGRFHPCLETAVFRIVQEALTNARRHAHVEEAMVTITADDTGLTVHVKDEGVGFVPDLVFASGKTAGLSGMHERATLLGGRCDVESAPGTGAQIRVRFPFSEVAKREAAARAGLEQHD
jgi:PAS domain S-box-containing protein